MLIAKGLSKDYGKNRVVNRVSVAVERGEAVGLVGPNGAGKSTILRLITGLAAPDEGSVVLDRLDLQRDRCRYLSKVGALIESPAFYPAMSAVQHLRFLNRINGLAADTGVGEGLELVGLADVGAKPVSAYSLGMRQRLGLAMALRGDPELLVLDEPTNGLDPQGIHDLRRILADLTERRRIGVLLSSHHLSEVDQVCRRVVFISHGSVVRVRSQASVSASPVVQMLVRTTMNAAAEGALRQSGIESVPTPDGHLLCVIAPSAVTRVAEALVTAGIGLLELKEKRASLEDDYLQTLNSGG